jgi:prepilin signal peptidase PulO-like enzyme (type II secretory pathway)
VYPILFILGTAFGSFLNVVALRYDAARSLFAPANGRSHCPHCKKTLRWFELIPLLSFALQNGRCRSCGKQIKHRYLLVELATGLLFVFVAMSVPRLYAAPYPFYAILAIYLAAFVTLFLMALIDARLSIIPDGIHFILLGLGALKLLVLSGFSALQMTFVPRHALLFGLQGSPWLNSITAALIGAAFFFFLFAATKGKGMGFGDVKLAAALGFLFGWPDILFITVFAFLVGSIFGAWKIWKGKKKMKSAVPFGPFLALGVLILVLWGRHILSFYFGLFGW